MKNRNFKISDEDHARLKTLAASRRETIGRTIGHLLNQNDRMIIGETARRIKDASIATQADTIRILERLLSLKNENA